MLVLVDGYNVTMADPGLAGRSKEQQRDALCARLRVLAPKIAPGGRIVVVFDAHISPMTTAEDAGGIRVLYADSADSEIVKRCAGATGNVTVYTNDLRLRARISQDVGRRVRYADASALFGGRIAGASPKSGQGRSRDDDALPAHERKRIDQELGELWGEDDE